MKWIIDSQNRVINNESELSARTEFIRNITGADVTGWQFLTLKNSKTRFLVCLSNDGLDGTFITAHFQDVYALCTYKEVYNCKFIIANTCIWTKDFDKSLLTGLLNVNRNIELWFSRQEVYVDPNGEMRQTTPLLNIGNFGFRSSLSERQLYKNRSIGIKCAIKESFNKVSLVLRY